MAAIGYPTDCKPSVKSLAGQFSFGLLNRVEKNLACHNARDLIVATFYYLCLYLPTKIEHFWNITNIYGNFCSIMEQKEKLKVLNDAYALCIERGRVKNRKEFADLLGVHRTTLSSAFNGDEKYLTDKLISRAIDVIKSTPAEDTSGTVLVLPAEARGGTIADFVDAVHEYDCERIVSPVRGAQYAMQVVGDSMEPEYPNGSRILMKRINEEIFVEWGKVYVLDTENGALLKKIRKTEKSGVVECVSLNSKYDSFTINTQYIHGWYRVLMVLSLK